MPAEDTLGSVHPHHGQRKQVPTRTAYSQRKGAMTHLPHLPHRSPRNVSAAIYGLILGASIVAASSVDHGDQPTVVEIYLCVTVLVFFLAHVYAKVIGNWIEGASPTADAVIRELRWEWPMIAAQAAPAAILLLGALGLIAPSPAITVALLVALLELFLAVGYACRQAKASRNQVMVSGAAAALFAIAIVLLKILVHG
jgi:hypothetical protein